MHALLHETLLKISKALPSCIPGIASRSQLRVFSTETKERSQFSLWVSKNLSWIDTLWISNTVSRTRTKLQRTEESSEYKWLFLSWLLNKWVLWYQLEIAGQHWWGDRKGGAIVTNLWPLMTPNDVSSVVYSYKWWSFHTMLKHSVKTSARGSDLKVGIWELSFQRSE